MKSGANEAKIDVDSEIAKLASTGVRIPPQPRIVLEVAALLRRQDADLREMADLIGQDAGLTAMLYKVTRASAFSRRKAPESVDKVLSIIGLRQTAAIVQAYGITEALGGSAPALDQFWIRSGAIAQIASVVAADRVAVCNIFPEQAYMAGIFHDCGVPILMQRFPEYCHATGVDGLANKWADVRTEDAAFHVDHCSIGYLLAKHWRLPDFVADAIHFHHELDRLSTQASRSMVAVLQLAIHFYSQHAGYMNPDWGSIGLLALEELGIHPDDLNEFADSAMDTYQALEDG